MYLHRDAKRTLDSSKCLPIIVYHRQYIIIIINKDESSEIKSNIYLISNERFIIFGALLVDWCLSDKIKKNPLYLIKNPMIFAITSLNI